MTNFEDKISLMIPAYLRGELSDAERQEVEMLAEKNPSIAADIEFQKNLKTALKSDEDTFQPGELGWARLSKAMAEDDANKSAIVESVLKAPKFWKYAAAILVVAAVGQAGVIGSMASKSGENSQYLTASENIPSLPSVKLGFNPDISADKITETLQSAEVSIIAGPSSLGLYDIQFSSAEACVQGVKNLKANPDVVDMVTACE